MSLDLTTLAATVQSLPPDKQKEAIDLIGRISGIKVKELAQGDFLAFVKEVWPAFIEGQHHKIMADAFNRIADGTLKRLIVNMPPRHSLPHIFFLHGTWVGFQIKKLFKQHIPQSLRLALVVRFVTL